MADPYGKRRCRHCGRMFAPSAATVHQRFTDVGYSYEHEYDAAADIDMCKRCESGK